MTKEAGAPISALFAWCIERCLFAIYTGIYWSQSCFETPLASKSLVESRRSARGVGAEATTVALVSTLWHVCGA
jgi:hypothetical protein